MKMRAASVFLFGLVTLSAWVSVEGALSLRSRRPLQPLARSGLPGIDCLGTNNEPLRHPIVASGQEDTASGLVDLTTSTSGVTVILHGGTIDIDISGPLVARHGEEVTYTYEVTYTSPAGVDDGTTASDIEVQDDECSPVQYVSGDTNGDGLLGLSETWLFDCTTNMPTYRPGGPDRVTHQATVSGKGFDGEDLDDDDTHETIIDRAEGEFDVVIVGPETMKSGDDVTFTYLVTYSSDDGTPGDITNLTDSQCSPIDLLSFSGDNDLENGLVDVGEVWVFTCVTSHSGDNGDQFVHEVELDGNDADGASVDTAEDELVVTIRDATMIVQFVEDGQPAEYGEVVTFSYTVTLTNGSASVENVQVSVPGVCDGGANPVLQGGDASLDANEVYTFTCTATMPASYDPTVEEEPIVHDVTATATTVVGGEDVAARDLGFTPLSHTEGVLDIEIEASENVRAGDETEIRFVVDYNSTDGSPAANVNVESNICTPVYESGDTNGDGLLDNNEVWIFVCTVTVPDGGLTVNATATGEDLDGDSLSDDDDELIISSSEGALIVEFLGVTTARHEDDVEFQYAVSYDSTVSLNGARSVTVTVGPNICNGDANPTYSHGDNGNGILDLFEVWVFTCLSHIPDQHSATCP